jgi:hypothetical protein
MGTRGLCSGCKAKLELADESVMNGIIPGHIYDFLTFSTVQQQPFTGAQGLFPCPV